MKIASIDTDNQDRGDHLRNDDFFDAEKFPTKVFMSTGVKTTNAAEGRLQGELTRHGVTKPVTLDLEINGTVTNPWGKDRAGVSLAGKINRKDWGLAYNSTLESGGVALG